MEPGGFTVGAGIGVGVGDWLQKYFEGPAKLKMRMVKA